MSCGLDEFPCRGKEGEGKHKACRSAAQTWATSKAYRLKYSFIAKLGGYEPTPAEEMLGERTEAENQAPKEHWCEEHNCPLGKLKTKSTGVPFWAHRTPDGKLCYGKPPAKQLPKAPSPPKPEHFPTPETIRNLGDLFNASLTHFKINKDQTLKELGYSTQAAIANPGEEWQRLVALKTEAIEGNERQER